jgi:hypothetical protein
MWLAKNVQPKSYFIVEFKRVRNFRTIDDQLLLAEKLRHEGDKRKKGK